MPLTHTLMDWPSSKSNFETFVKSPFNFSFSDNATVLLDFIPMMYSGLKNQDKILRNLLPIIKQHFSMPLNKHSWAFYSQC